MVGIVVIAYNKPDFIRLQIEKISKYCKDVHEIVIVDNSTDREMSAAVKYHSEGRKYIKTNASSSGGSQSHSFAANLSFMRLCGKYDYFLYLDHDCFPVMDFSVPEILGEKIIAGVGQVKGEKTYLWPGCLMWKGEAIAPGYIDFSPNEELGLDTGGNLYRIVDHYGREKVLFLNEEHCENPQFNKSFYNFYCMINNGMFMHFVNGSVWNKTVSDDERVNSLINILTEKTK
jgi:glycosyltransferase involved in cell wall biosynthesis